MATFTEQVAAWAKEAEAKAHLAAKESVTRTIKLANTPRGAPSGGYIGAMPVATGFLRNSLAAQIGTMPSGPSVGPIMGKGGTYRLRDPMGDPSQAFTVIASWDLKSELFIGWTADYANIQESEKHFRDMTADSFPHIAYDVVEDMNGGYL